MISDIAFESNYPYSLHPTAVNSSINVGDIYCYQSGVRVLITGGSYDNGASCGPLCFYVYNDLTFSIVWIGSSGYPKYPKTTAINSSINVGDIYYYSGGVRLLCTGGDYYNGAKCGPLCFDVYEALTFSNVWLGSSVPGVSGTFE